ncbi:hypothetical protein II906_00720 [bacterium]|nr:hypothetical protein [bacterium]
MPNGISCAIFAGKNIYNGLRDKNVFRDGIGIIQTTRTADAALNSGIAAGKLAESSVCVAAKTTLKTVAGIAKKCLYPLIIGSGIFNTIKSKDKVKTGVSQGCAIGTMYGMEQLAEKTFLKNLDAKFAHCPNKKVKVGWYVAKGLTYAACSLGGYEIGNKIGTKIVDKVRAHKETKNVENSVPSSDVEYTEDIIFDKMRIGGTE